MTLRRTTGGLATGLGSVYKTFDCCWVGWSGLAPERLSVQEKAEIMDLMHAEKLYPLFLSQADLDRYYRGFCNKVIWPLFHYFTTYATYDPRYWESYERVNELFCEAVLDVAESGDMIWIHDYHLMLLPHLIRERIADVQIGYFLHIPFPSFEVFRLCPWRKELLIGLLGSDLVGFHTYDYVRHFLSSVRALTEYEHSLGQISVGNRIAKADVFPMGIDYERYARAPNEPDVKKEIASMRKTFGETQVIASVNRMEYTKGIPNRLEAFDLFLDKYPEYKGKVTLVLVTEPSRIRVEQYALLKKTVEQIVGRINGKHGTIEWIPVRYLYRGLRFPRLPALYSVADVALVTPLRDGMNLIAKEFVATKTDGKGVLILSETAGAAREMGEALTVNVNNREEMAEALNLALTMSEEEQVARNSTMQQRLSRHTVAKWSTDFLDELDEVVHLQMELRLNKLDDPAKGQLVKDYGQAAERLFLLDYDGTLRAFVSSPEDARPDEELYALLEALAAESKNEIVLISGRDRGTLEQWFGHLNVGLVAEHGARLKNKGGRWVLSERMANTWKRTIRPVLDSCADRTPGSFVEEKEFSLVWHFRKVDPHLAEVRSSELRNDLTSLTGDMDLGVMEGNKIIEVKPFRVNKGRAAARWIAGKHWDFIFAAGDDYTDEDTFVALPEDAYSVRVGYRPSKARFSLGSVEEVRSLLEQLVR